MTITNIELLEVIAAALDELCNEVVFVGGAITGLLVTDPAARSPSATKDVDVIVSVTTKTEYLDRLSRTMRRLGFHEDSNDDAPICRWRWQGAVRLDLMPTDPSVLGFANRWFPAAFQHARPSRLPSGKAIRVITAPYFIATKLEAFHSRGAEDFMGSKDIEDLVAVLHGRAELLAEVRTVTSDLREYLAEQADDLLGTRAFEQSLEGHLPGEDTEVVMRVLKQFVGLGRA